MKGYKIFLDTVHGYISVPNGYCDKFVDTANFQRLRRIEQLSSRSLYPCARHDRFVHSIAVFHIGERLLDTIKSDGVELDESLRQSFLIACLLHDVVTLRFLIHWRAVLVARPICLTCISHIL